MTSERSLRGRLTLLLIAGVGALLLLAAITVRWMIGRWLESEFDGALLTKARVLVTLTKQDALEVELDFADEYMPEFQRQLNPEYFQLWLDDDSVLERSDSMAGKDLARGGALSSAPGYRSIELPDGRSGRQVQVDFVPQVEDDGGSDVDVPLNPRLLTSASGYRWASVVVARSREQLPHRHRFGRRTDRHRQRRFADADRPALEPRTDPAGGPALRRLEAHRRSDGRDQDP